MTYVEGRIGAALPKVRKGLNCPKDSVIWPFCQEGLPVRQAQGKLSLSKLDK